MPGPGPKPGQLDLTPRTEPRDSLTSGGARLTARTLVLVQPSQGAAMGGGSCEEGNLDMPVPVLGWWRPRQPPPVRSHLPSPSSCPSAGIGDRCWAQIPDPMEGGMEGGTEGEEGQQFPNKRAEEHGAAVGSPAAHGGDSECPRLPFPLRAPHQQRAPWPTRSMFCFLSPSGGHMG